MATQPEIIRPRVRTPSEILSLATAPFRWYWDFARKKPLGGVGLVLIIILVLIAFTGPWLVHEVMNQDELRIHLEKGAKFHEPEWRFGQDRFFLGADHQGRDVLSRIIIGARVSLYIALVSVFFGQGIGWFLGLISGYFLGWVDSLIQRVVDMKMSLPSIVLAIAIVSVLGRDQNNIILAIALTQVAGSARICRSTVLSIRTMDYVLAARATGASNLRIMLQHILPQTFAPAMVLVTAAVGGAILTESSLAFLGLGTRPPNPSWGAMLSRDTLTNVQLAPWNAVWPGVALSLTVYSFNLLGDALRDVLDPRLRR